VHRRELTQRAIGQHNRIGELGDHVLHRLADPQEAYAQNGVPRTGSYVPTAARSGREASGV
jgi:hypothetical protein